MTLTVEVDVDRRYLDVDAQNGAAFSDFCHAAYSVHIGA
jgi:hypothetical protein